MGDGIQVVFLNPGEEAPFFTGEIMGLRPLIPDAYKLASMVLDITQYLTRVLTTTPLISILSRVGPILALALCISTSDPFSPGTVVSSWLRPYRRDFIYKLSMCVAVALSVASLLQSVQGFRTLHSITIPSFNRHPVVMVGALKLLAEVAPMWLFSVLERKFYYALSRLQTEGSEGRMVGRILSQVVRAVASKLGFLVIMASFYPASMGSFVF